MLVYPLTSLEQSVICWAARIAPVLAVVVIFLFGAVSVASALA